MFVGELPTGFQFNQKVCIDHQIGKKITEQRAILIINMEWILLFYIQAKPAEAMSERILVNLFHVTVPQKAMNRRTGFTDLSAERNNLWIMVRLGFCDFCAFCGHYSVEATFSGWPPAQR